MFPISMVEAKQQSGTVVRRELQVQIKTHWAYLCKRQTVSVSWRRLRRHNHGNTSVKCFEGVLEQLFSKCDCRTGTGELYRAKPDAVKSYKRVNALRSFTAKPKFERRKSH